MNNANPSFGGTWTREKLDILERYLDAYTTALKNKPFKLMYIDAFAGSGQIKMFDKDAEEFISGSAERAVNIKDKSFDKLIFIEKNSERIQSLETLRTEYSGRRNILIENMDANEYLQTLDENWKQWRGVLFLDPFGTEVDWSTIENVESFKALDTWILFPVSAIARLLPNSKQPDDVDPKWACRLNKVYGDESWRNLYRKSRQTTIFGEPEVERESGLVGLSNIYRQKLKKLFGNRFIDQQRFLSNSKNSHLFEFIFCVGNSSGVRPAKRIAEHILKNF